VAVPFLRRKRSKVLVELLSDTGLTSTGRKSDFVKIVYIELQDIPFDHTAHIPYKF
jgi:hypothetical protein